MKNKKVEPVNKKYLLKPKAKEPLSQNEQDYGTYKGWMRSLERKALNEFKKQQA